MAPCSYPTKYEDLVSLEAVRSQADLVLKAARKGQLNNFDYDESRMPEAVDFVANIISRDYGPDRYDQIPSHGRLQHFNSGGIDRLSPILNEWKRDGADDVEVCRRVVDLLFFSVLVDAGAGDTWKFKEPGTDRVYVRSEGIAVASWLMFIDGQLQTAGTTPHSVDGRALAQIDGATMCKYFQSSPDNAMTGFSSRVTLLNKLGESLLKLPEIFGEIGRPGNLVDYLRQHEQSKGVLDFAILWKVLQRLLLPIWPKERTHLNGSPLGDAWPLQVLSREAEAAGDRSNIARTIQPFHKLTQWLAYSLRVPFTKFLGFRWSDEELSTALAEYRHGGVFVDLDVLRLKPVVLHDGQRNSGHGLAQFDAKSDAIVEWRAMTVALIDELHRMVVKQLGVSLTLAQVLEAGSFKAGRELAAKYRPETRSGPILISGDGTLL